MEANITSSGKKLFAADAVILPGVGAFGDAMAALKRLDLVTPLRDIAQSDKWLIGICLGLQLLMSESCEFGNHKGLDIIKGQVLPIDNPIQVNPDGSRTLKVPQVGWNRVWQTSEKGLNSNTGAKSWEETPMKGVQNGEFMYFVHSYFVKPERKDAVISTSVYGQIEFCSSLQYNKIFACQFHPERSGKQGLKVYENVAEIIH